VPARQSGIASTSRTSLCRAPMGHATHRSCFLVLASVAVVASAPRCRSSADSQSAPAPPDGRTSRALNQIRVSVINALHAAVASTAAHNVRRYCRRSNLVCAALAQGLDHRRIATNPLAILGLEVAVDPDGIDGGLSVEERTEKLADSERKLLVLELSVAA
jgi:hypothetical protein